MQVFVNGKRINKIQIQIILEFFGVPLKQQTSQLKKDCALLQSIAEGDPDEFDRLYDLVVRKINPQSEPAPAPVNGVDLAVKSALESERARSEAIIAAHVQERAEKLQIDFCNDLYTIINAEKKAFNRIEHVIKNEKTQTIKKIDRALPAEFQKILDLAQARKNILLVGPSGCGKTYISEILADALNLPYAAQSCSIGVSESNFTGWLLPTGDNGKFNHVVSSFLECYEKGGVFLVDEIDNADPNLLVFLNMALANNSFYLPQRFKNPKVVKHDDFICIAAANTFGHGSDEMYSSRNRLDAATLDRFRIGTVAMDYDAAVEESIIKNSSVLNFGRFVREQIADHGLAKIMSTRAMRDMDHMMTGFGWQLKDCAAAYFADWSPEEKAMIQSDMSEFLIKEAYREDG